jgi:hypothetical protein
MLFDQCTVERCRVAIDEQSDEQSRCVGRRQDVDDTQSAQNIITRFAGQKLVERFGDLTAELFGFVVFFLLRTAWFEKLSRVDGVVVVDFSTVSEQLLALSFA